MYPNTTNLLISNKMSLVKKIAILSLALGINCIEVYAQEERSSGFVKESGTMAERWELGDTNHKGFFIITPYKPVYVTAGRYSTNPNGRPTSENPKYSLPFSIGYNNYESKFQFSFKTKMARRIFWGKGDLWAAYTQKAHWQIYNAKLSRPFRELNYEPEIILNFPTNYQILGFKGSMVGVAFNHQSNGRVLPLSRSWNRVVFQAGFERKNWQITLKPWIRLKDEEDENPAISDFTGRGETIIVYNYKKYQFSAVAAHSLRFKNGGRGSLQLNGVFPVWQNLYGQLQVSDGYGETLQDYNHRQQTIGVSVSLVNW